MDKSRFLVFLQLRNIPLRRILPPVLVDLGPKIPLKDDISLQQLQKTLLEISYRYPALITGRICFKLTLQMNLIGKNVDKTLISGNFFSILSTKYSKNLLKSWRKNTIHEVHTYHHNFWTVYRIRTNDPSLKNYLNFLSIDILFRLAI